MKYVTHRKDYKAVINILIKVNEGLNVLSKAVRAVISRIAVSVSQLKGSSQTATICSSVMLFGEQMTMIVGRSVFLDLICFSGENKQLINKAIAEACWQHTKNILPFKERPSSFLLLGF